jgi:hypothetical protein
MVRMSAKPMSSVHLLVSAAFGSGQQTAKWCVTCSAVHFAQSHALLEAVTEPVQSISAFIQQLLLCRHNPLSTEGSQQYATHADIYNHKYSPNSGPETILSPPYPLSIPSLIPPQSVAHNAMRLRPLLPSFFPVVCSLPACCLQRQARRSLHLSHPRERARKSCQARRYL